MSIDAIPFPAQLTRHPEGQQVQDVVFDGHCRVRFWVVVRV
jgi:hypothetical protein